jgi:hypothetical protein
VTTAAELVATVRAILLEHRDETITTALARELACAIGRDVLRFDLDAPGYPGRDECRAYSDLAAAIMVRGGMVIDWRVADERARNIVTQAEMMGY